MYFTYATKYYSLKKVNLYSRASSKNNYIYISNIKKIKQNRNFSTKSFQKEIENRDLLMRQHLSILQKEKMLKLILDILAVIFSLFAPILYIVFLLMQSEVFDLMFRSPIPDQEITNLPIEILVTQIDNNFTEIDTNSMETDTNFIEIDNNFTEIDTNSMESKCYTENCYLESDEYDPFLDCNLEIT
jgi:hypothetical protein